MVSTAYPVIGIIPMPADFKYEEVLRLGRPRHEKWDSFSLRHPPMTAAHWAKIFCPFDALDGFDERIAEKEVLYEARIELCDQTRVELDRRLNILHNLAWNSRMARANRVMVSVTYFVPCADENHFAFQVSAGQYDTATGMVLRVDSESLHLRTEKGDKGIRFGDIREITSKTEIFDTEWEMA